jgi:hypothetical protein
LLRLRFFARCARLRAHCGAGGVALRCCVCALRARSRRACGDARCVRTRNALTRRRDACAHKRSFMLRCWSAEGRYVISLSEARPSR